MPWEGLLRGANGMHASRTSSRCLAALLPLGPRAACSRVGRAKRTVGTNRNRIGRGLAERVDHLVTPVLELGQHLFGNAALGAHVIRQPLMVHTGCGDGGG